MGDPQRFRVYKAEKIIPAGDKYPEVPDVVRFVNDLLARPWFRAIWKQGPITVKDGRRRRSAYGNASRSEIGMPRWSRQTREILHEVAHVLSAWDGHGPRFCRNYVRLVEGVYGRHTAMLFEGSLIGRGCEVAPERLALPFSKAGTGVPRPEPVAAGPKCCPTCKRAF